MTVMAGTHTRCLFFNETATTEIYTLSLHDALPICGGVARRAPGYVLPVAPLRGCARVRLRGRGAPGGRPPHARRALRSEEHTSELQSRQYLVCRLLLEKKIISARASPPLYHTPEQP